MVNFFVCLLPVRLLLLSNAVLYHVNDQLQRAYSPINKWNLSPQFLTHPLLLELFPLFGKIQTSQQSQRPSFLQLKVISDLYLLTPSLSKVLEDFGVTWMIDDITNKIDPKQFGCLKGTSTAFCLLYMMHTWWSYLSRFT